MNKSLMVFVACVGMTLAGCGGGGGGSSSPPPAPPPPPPPSDASPGGHWFGTVTNEFSAVTEEYIAMVDESGRFRFVSVDSAVQFSGNFVVTLNSMTGDAMAFADAGVFWLDGTSATPANFTGTVLEGDTMTGSWTTDSGEFGTFEFFYDPTFYERAVTLAMLEAVWTGYDELLNPVVTFTVAADGSFTGQNAQGCNSIGQFTLVEPGFNLYEIQSTVSDCSIAGNYIGLAFLADVLVPNDVMVLAIDNGTRAIALGLEK